MKKILLALMILAGLDSMAQNRIVATWPGYPKADTIIYYVPEPAEPGARFPAVILLHGYGGGPWQWPQICSLQSLASQYRMLIACPDGFSDSWYIDSPGGQGCYAQFFAQAILPAIEQRLPVDTSMMFIDGMSMGGHGALHLAVKCCGKFKAAGSMSGVLDLRKSALASSSISKLLGPCSDTSQTWAKFSAVDQAGAIKDCGIPIIVSCGAQDYLAGANRQFALRCSQIGINAVYVESPGRHDRAYWSVQLPEHIRFFRKFINK